MFDCEVYAIRWIKVFANLRRLIPVNGLKKDIPHLPLRVAPPSPLFAGGALVVGVPALGAPTGGALVLGVLASGAPVLGTFCAGAPDLGALGAEALALGVLGEAAGGEFCDGRGGVDTVFREPSRYDGVDL